MSYLESVTQRGEAMQQNEEKSWYVLYTKPRWEKKIASRLQDLGIETYCPLNRVERRWSDRKKVVLEPLFRCYVFVRLTAEDLYKPLNISGVFNFVCGMNRPAQVYDHEIDAIKRFLSEYNNVGVEKIDVDVDDMIEITHGPFMDHKGYITSVNDNYVKVAIHSLGYSLVATVNRTGIKKLEEQIH